MKTEVVAKSCVKYGVSNEFDDTEDDNLFFTIIFILFLLYWNHEGLFFVGINTYLTKTVTSERFLVDGVGAHPSISPLNPSVS